MARKTSGVTVPTQLRLTPSDLAAAEAIQNHFHLGSRTAAVRLAIWHLADSLPTPAKPQPPPKKKPKKTERSG